MVDFYSKSQYDSATRAVFIKAFTDIIKVNFSSVRLGGIME